MVHRYQLLLEFREDIDPEGSTCKSIRGREECTVRKAIPHHFDRLAQDEVFQIDVDRWSHDVLLTTEKVAEIHIH